jgi:hypothetical protein
MKEYWEKENLSFIVSNSFTKSEVLKKLGLRSAGNNGITLNKYIELYDLDISHFKKRWENMIQKVKNSKIPLELILIENSNFNRSHLKERLYESGLKIKKCEKCGQDESWNNEKISLILDHINGIYNDNRIENLRILCPNCNATLPTHCRKTTIKNNIQENSELNKKKKKEKILEVIKKIKESNIDFSKFGWVKEIAKIIGCTDQHVNRWMKKNMLDFYSTNCFIRTHNTSYLN